VYGLRFDLNHQYAGNKRTISTLALSLLVVHWVHTILAANSLDKELAQTRLNILTSEIVLNANVSSALSICDKQREKAEERDKFGSDVINPNDQSKRPFFRPPGKDLSARDCQTVSRISSDIQEDRLMTVADYDIAHYRIYNTFAWKIAESTWKLAERYLWGKFSLVDTNLMPNVAASIVRITDARARETAINGKKSGRTYVYASKFKNYWPVLLGVGIGIRLARTHYDAKAEKEKEEAEKAKAAAEEANLEAEEAKLEAEKEKGVVREGIPLRAEGESPRRG
jgi:hypothetical protein